MGEAAQRQAEQPRRGGVILGEGVDLLLVRLAQIKVVVRYRQILDLTYLLTHWLTPMGEKMRRASLLHPSPKKSRTSGSSRAACGPVNSAAACNPM